MMKEDPNENSKSKFMISYKDYFFGFLSFLWRYPILNRGGYKTNKLNPNTYDSIGKLVEKIARKHPNQNAIIYENQRYTYKEYNEIVNQFANYFLSIGIKKGDIVNLFIENRPEIIFIITAMSKIGAIASLINTNQKKKALVHSLTISPVKLYLIGEEVYPKFNEISKELSLKKETKLFIIFENRNTKISNEFIDLFEMIRSFSKENPSTTKRMQLKDVYIHIFTSGTTGLPKAVPISNYRTMGGIIFYGYILLRMGLDDVIYSPLPFYHSNAINVGWAAALGGCSTLVIKRRFSASEFWEDIRNYNATTFNYIGELCRYLLNQPPSKDDKNHNVSIITGNGLRPEIWKEFKNRFGIREIYEFYGATEISGVFFNLFNLDCTLGVNFDPYKIVKYDIENERLVKDNNGHLIEVEEGQEGLLLMKIKDFINYAGYTNEEATKKKLLINPFGEGDNWFNTGDLLRKIGYHHTQFVDRIGDTFRWKGENVSTKEVEEILSNFDEIDFSAVYGVKLPGTEGKIGMASIFLNIEPTDFKLSKFYKYINENLPKYAFPYFLRIISQIELTDTAKIKKAKLKQDAFDISCIKDEIFVLIPIKNEYYKLSEEIYNDILNEKYRF